MQIFAKMQSGKVITLDVNPDYSIMAVKKQIMEKGGFFPDQQCLIFSGRKLDNSLTLTDYRAVFN